MSRASRPDPPTPFRPPRDLADLSPGGVAQPIAASRTYQSPGARKEKLRERSYHRGDTHADTHTNARTTTHSHSRPPLPYAELRTASAFSFLDGASLPEDLVARAAELELPAVALVDRSGVYGAPRFWKAAKAAGLKPLVGAEVVLDLQASLFESHERDREREKENERERSKSKSFHRREKRKDGSEDPGEESIDDAIEEASEASGAGGSRAARSRRASGFSPSLKAFASSSSSSVLSASPRLTLLAENRTGYRNLCKLLTAAALGRAKGSACAGWELVAAHAEGLHLLTGGDESPLAALLDAGEVDGARALVERWAHAFPGRVHVELQRHGRRDQERRNRLAVELARRLRLPLVAAHGVRFARAEDKPLFDVLTAIRNHVPLDAAGALLAPNRARHLASAGEMARRFADLPEAVTHAWELSQRLAFTLDDLGYRFPEFPLPPGETAASYLRQLTWSAARSRFRPLTAKAQAQIQKELDLIEKLDLAGYFLIVGEIVDFCRRERILCQGRGSAANSAVCYALGITAVDPVKMELLFERFLSEERGEWPDIDLDLPSGDQREKVIQHVYRTYGGSGNDSAAAETCGGVRAGCGGAPLAVGAAMTANVITYRDRSASREVGKALGFSTGQIDTIAKQLGSFRYDLERGDAKSFEKEMRAAGFDPDERRIRLFGEYWRRIQNLPRHLGQHSGGMVIAQGRLDEVVPLEPAAMPGRVVVQWDKDDCADLGIIKIDLLGLGMLNALEQVIPIVRTHERVQLDLAHLPADDPAVYAMLRAADTVGVFQVESRAQMASLPRNAPTRFYDLVIQVAIIRPGPITGGMVHPFFERRRGREEVTYFHPCLEPILKRTLGVPIFQEQLLRMAMAVSGFTGGEAEELRRAMGFKRSVERMEAIEQRLRAGMAAKGIVGEAQDRIVQSITSFALYGFPESHAASFALIAYASAYLKCHHPTAFLIGLLNAWPMGFYHPATLVKDAERHGVRVLPIDVHASRYDCVWEEVEEQLDRNGEGDDESKAIKTKAKSEKHSLKGKAKTAAPRAPGGCRLGLRFVDGLKRATAERIVAERDRGGPFRDVDDLVRRAALRGDEVERLAALGALASLGLSRRAALWQASLAVRPTGPLFEAGEAAPSRLSPKTEKEKLSLKEEKKDEMSSVRPSEGLSSFPSMKALAFSSSVSSSASSPEHPLSEMTAYQETLADFAGTGLTTGAHPMTYWRAGLARQGVISAAELPRRPHGERVRIAGAVIVRQRPGTAKGTLFLTLEDESGMAQAIVSQPLLHEHRATIVGNPGLVVEGKVVTKDGSTSVRAERFWPLRHLIDTPSHDFR